MDSADRIIALKRHLKLRGTVELAEKIGIHPNRIYNIEQRKTPGISTPIAIGIHKLDPSINLVWILTGEGEMLNPEQPKSITYPEAVKGEMIEMMQSEINYLKKAVEQKDKIIKGLLDQLNGQ